MMTLKHPGTPILFFRSRTLSLIWYWFSVPKPLPFSATGTQTATSGTRCSFGPPHLVCFFDALRDTVKMVVKAPKRTPGGPLGLDSSSNPVKKQALTRNWRSVTPSRNFSPSGRRGRIAAWNCKLFRAV